MIFARYISNVPSVIRHLHVRPHNPAWAVVAVAGALAATSLSADPEILEATVSTGSASDGETVTLNYRIESSSSIDGWLGATMTAPNGTVAEDRTHEDPVEDRITVHSGTHWYSREFFINLPPGADFGAYDVAWGFHSNGGDTAVVRETDAIRILEPFPVDVPILMYHKVGPVAHSEYWVTTDQFEKQVRALLEHGYTPVTLQDVVDYRAGLKSAPAKPVVITFDDGYEDLHTYVLPIVEKADLRVPVTAFVLPGRPGEENTWDDGIDFDQEPKVKHLTWNQTEDLQASGLFDLQSHTMTHANLVDISREERMQELIQSRLELNEKLDKETLFFAYPWGSGAHHSDIRHNLREAGYFLAVGINNVPETRAREKWALYRHNIHWDVTAEYDSANEENFLFGPELLNDPDAYPDSERYHPADVNRDWEIATSEVTAYASAWRRGETWGNDSDDIETAYVTRSGAIWRNGGGYSYDSSAGSGAAALVPDS